MTPAELLITRAYTAFNDRDVESALALMSETVSWPKASEGGRVVGKAEVRAYWKRQWNEFDPHVQPLEIAGMEDGRTRVKVHQVVKGLSGNLLADSEVWHIFTLANRLIERMDLEEDELDADPGPSSAFSHPDA